MQLIIKYLGNNSKYIYSCFSKIKNHNVISIDCSNNNLTSLPNSMNKLLPNLRHLNCSNNNLTSLPENINYPKLNNLNCSNNNIASLPDNINKVLPNLLVCNVSNNKLTSLSINTTNELLVYNSLWYLDCSYNKLNELPYNINIIFPKLYYLSCESNKLKTLPLSLLDCKKLKYIHFNHNNIDNLPKKLFRLTHKLNQIRINKIKRINPNFFNNN
jgi:Leucine-rich repeat (LRR) protein